MDYIIDGLKIILNFILTIGIPIACLIKIFIDVRRGTKKRIASIIILTIILLCYGVFYYGAYSKLHYAMVRQQRTLAKKDISKINTALQSYENKYKQLPNTLDVLYPDYIDTIPTDPWGNQYTYQIQTDSNYLIFTNGGSDIKTQNKYDSYNHKGWDIVYTKSDMEITEIPK